MSAKDTGGQQRVTRRESEDPQSVEANPQVAERKEQLDEDIDAILDEIDSVLEENSEEFVRGFVQKGGQ